jgi:hypothetical protein
MPPSLRVCTHLRNGAVSCAGRGSLKLLEDLRGLVLASGLPWHVEETVCLGYCHIGPNIKGAPGGPILHQCQDALSVLDQMDTHWDRSE